MAKSHPTVVRLNTEELAMLDHVAESKERGDYNRSEIIRLLIRREFNRRTTGSSKVDHSDVATDFRIGRPTTKRSRKGS